MLQFVMVNKPGQSNNPPKEPQQELEQQVEAVIYQVGTSQAASRC